jgi:hypothetical protein
MVGDNGGKMMSEKEYEDYKKNYGKVDFSIHVRKPKIESTAHGAIQRDLIAK